jgi:hypothetical protein
MLITPEMKTLTLFRGLKVLKNEADCIIEDIKLNGLNQSDKQEWEDIGWKNLKNDLESLYAKPNLTRDDTSPSVRIEGKNGGGSLKYKDLQPSLFFADKIGGEYYARRGSLYNTIPLLITVDLQIENIAIDGRDFLVKVFQKIDRNDLDKTKRQTEKLKRIFGNKIERYVEKIIANPLSDKYAIYDLVINDDEIIIDHSNNEEVIKGASETIFKSAFLGRTPIPPEKIKTVELIEEDVPNKFPTITLNDILET